MNQVIDGKALVYCEKAFDTPSGKTAHGLVRFTQRYDVVGIIDSRHAGEDAGEVLNGKSKNIPIYESLTDALSHHKDTQFFVIGLAPDGGRFPDFVRKDITLALESGLHVDSGLHDFLSNDPEFQAIASQKNVVIRDIRKSPSRDSLHFFSGNIEKVNCLKVAVLGTDSAIGKRTTAWMLVHGLHQKSLKAEMIGTGQTAWMQGAKYSIVLDSLINDFVSGEIEHAIYSAWKNERPDVIVVEGQGSLMNPAYPGGFEILAASRPDFVVLQHAPTREEYDGFPGYPIQPLTDQIHAIEAVSGRKVQAITINHEGLKLPEIPAVCEKIEEETGLVTTDVLLDGPDRLIKLMKNYL